MPDYIDIASDKGLHLLLTNVSNYQYDFLKW